MQADPTTRAYWFALKDAISEYDKDVAWSMVPQCVRCGGCVEPFANCDFYDKAEGELTLEEQKDVSARYDRYDEWYGEQKLKRLGTIKSPEQGK